MFDSSIFSGQWIKLKTSHYFYLAIAVAFYFGLVSFFYSSSSEYIVQDDARQGVVWLEKWFDNSIFPNDYIADYALGQAKNSPGTEWIYKLGILFKIHPLFFAKIIPPILGIITSIYYFRFSIKIVPSGLCAFLSTVILTQNIWMNDDISSATPRAFLYPIFAGFLYYLVEGRFVFCIIFTALQTFFYPPFVLVHLCILGIRCIDISKRPLPLSKLKKPYLLASISFVIALVLLWPILNHGADSYGALVTREQMAAMPEFARNGRTPFFINDPLEFWFSGTSGLNTPVYPYAIWLAYLLPFLLKRTNKIKSLFYQPGIAILGQMITAALLLFFAAHLLLFKLYWPSRYPYHTFPFVFSISAGIVITIGIHRLQEWLRNGAFSTFNQWRKGLTVFFSSVVILLLTLPFLPSIFLGFQGWILGTSPDLYRFIAEKPKNTLIVGLGNETSNIPSFTLRSVLFAQEVAIPFHLQHYEKMRSHIIQVLSAQYATDVKILHNVIQRHKIDYWLVDLNAFDPRYLSKKGNEWLLQFQPQADEARKLLEAGVIPAIVPMIETCSVVKMNDIALLETACMIRDGAGNQ